MALRLRDRAATALASLASDQRGAVSFRIVIFLAGIVLFAVLYGIGMEVVEYVKPLADSQTNTSQGNDLFTWTTSIWGLAPVFALLAMGAWLLKQAVVIRR